MANQETKNMFLKCFFINLNNCFLCLSRLEYIFSNNGFNGHIEF